MLLASLKTRPNQKNQKIVNQLVNSKARWSSSYLHVSFHQQHTVRHIKYEASTLLMVLVVFFRLRCQSVPDPCTVSDFTRDYFVETKFQYFHNIELLCVNTRQFAGVPMWVCVLVCVFMDFEELNCFICKLTCSYFRHTRLKHLTSYLCF